jgi:hypothetical protein
MTEWQNDGMTKGNTICPRPFHGGGIKIFLSAREDIYLLWLVIMTESFSGMQKIMPRFFHVMYIIDQDPFCYEQLKMSLVWYDSNSIALYFPQLHSVTPLTDEGNVW